MGPNCIFICTTTYTFLLIMETVTMVLNKVHGLVGLPESVELPLAVDLLILVGAVIVAKSLMGMIKAFYVYFIRPGKNLRNYGEWAVVTGASDGIGKAYAGEFARAGLNVVLISRTQSRLDEAAAEIAAKSPNVEIKTIAVDMGSGKESGIYETIEAEIGSLNVGILVNNVGMSYDHAEYFDLLDDWRVETMVELNVAAMNWMTNLCFR